MDEPSRLLFVPSAANPARLFGLDAEERACRIAGNAGLECAEAAQPGRGAILANMGYAWDPAWLKFMAARPASVLMLDGDPVLAHISPDSGSSAVEAIMLGRGRAFDGLERVDAESAEISYDELRKRERPFVLPLHAENVEPVERAAYDASYKGCHRRTDALPLAQTRLLSDALGGRGRPEPECGHGDRRSSLRARLLPLLERPVLARYPRRLHLHGA
jgi:hypothetical protein